MLSVADLSRTGGPIMKTSSAVKVVGLASLFCLAGLELYRCAQRSPVKRREQIVANEAEQRVRYALQPVRKSASPAPGR